jgi:hypothetical protein
MDSAENFTFYGVVKSSDAIDVTQGWNFIGYPINTSHPVNETFSSVYGLYSEVTTYNTSLGDYVWYRPGNGNSTLLATNPGYGYWINMSMETTIIISQ